MLGTKVTNLTYQHVCAALRILLAEAAQKPIDKNDNFMFCVDNRILII